MPFKTSRPNDSLEIAIISTVRALFDRVDATDISDWKFMCLECRIFLHFFGTGVSYSGRR